MKKPRYKLKGNSILRIGFVAVSLLVQVGWLLLRVHWLNEYSERISAITSILVIVIVLKINSKNTNSAMKMPWIMVILAFPLLGLCLYLLFEILGDPGVGKRIRAVRREMKREDPASARQALAHLENQDLSAANQSRYLWKQTGYPVFENTMVKYYPEAKEALEAMKEELEKAQKFIFM